MLINQHLLSRVRQPARLSRVGALFLLAGLPASGARAQTSKAQQIDLVVTKFAEAGHFSGSIVVAESGRTIYDKAFGFANAELAVRNTPATRIGVASITKSMTSVILYRLMEQDRIRMSDRVSRFLPDFPRGDEITVGMLSRHRSGIPHRVMPSELETVPHTAAEMAQRISRASLEFAPDSARLYSSAGYSLLARILEIAAGKSYAELVRQYVFVPAGMSRSVDFAGEPLIDGRANDYLLDVGGPVNAPLKDLSFLVGAGSVLSTARDIHLFAQALASGKLGDSARAAVESDSVWWSNGSTNGHRAEVRLNRAHGYSYALVSNLNSGANDVILQAIRDIMEGKLASVPEVPTPRVVSRDSVSLAQYVGDYRREGGSGGFTVTASARGLFAGDIKLVPTGGDCFYDFKFYGEVCFVRGSSREIVHIDWVSPGVSSRWVKR